MYNKLKESLKGLLNEKTSPEETETIIGAIKEVETLESEHNRTIESAEHYRKKYISIITDGVGSNETGETATGTKEHKSLEEIAREKVSQ